MPVTLTIQSFSAMFLTYFPTPDRVLARSSSNKFRAASLSQSRFLSFAVLLASCVWCTGFFLAPLLVRSLPDTANGIYAFYGEVCHQFDERSLWLAGNPLAVCTRCFSIYTGFLIGSTLTFLLSARVSPPQRLQLVALIALVPMLLDVGGGMAGVWTSSTTTRIVTGGWFGFLSSLFLIPVAVEALREIRSPEARGVSSGV